MTDYSDARLIILKAELSNFDPKDGGDGSKLAAYIYRKSPMVIFTLTI